MANVRKPTGNSQRLLGYRVRFINRSGAGGLLLVGALLCSVGCSSLTPSLALSKLKFSSTQKPKAKQQPSLGSSQLTKSQSAEVFLTTARNMEAAGNDQEAAALYEQARGLDPEQIDYSAHLSRLYDRLNLTEQAKQEYEAAVSANPNDAELLNDYGVFHLRRMNAVTAESWFRKSLEINPKDQRTMVNLAGSLALQNRFPESHEAYSRAVGAAAAYSNIGVHLARQNRIAEAREHFRQALEQDPTIEPARELLAGIDAGQTNPLAAK